MPGSDRPHTSYSDAGVSIERGGELVERIKRHAKRTARPGVLAGIGGFASLFELSQAGYRDPVLVSGTDGVGTKIKLAVETQRHDQIGIDLVAMCVNDLVVQGAEPLFFLDYFACGSLDVDVAERVVAGIAAGCEIAGCALVGGETAEMPGMYKVNDYDLAGFCVGVVERDRIIDGHSISTGDVLIALASSGPHSNGYSLIRKIISDSGTNLDRKIGNRTLADVLLEPTRIYVRTVLELNKSIPLKGIAHITGGGITENLPRILPGSVAAEINRDAWEWPEIFKWLQQTGNVETEEMLRAFNCGIGMILVVQRGDVETTLEILGDCQEQAFIVGRAVPLAGSGPRVRYCDRSGP